MPATRVRVRPPHRHRGLMLLIVLYGVCAGAAYFGLGTAIERSSMTPRSGILVLFSVVVLIPAAAGLYLARCCQHTGPVFWGGVLCGSAFVVGIYIFAYLGESPGPAPWWAVFIAIGAALTAGALSGLLNLLLCAIHKNYGSLLVEQDGTLCVGCGYCVVHVSSPRCPECGTPRDAAIQSLGAIHAAADVVDRTVGRRLPRLRYVVVLAALGGGLWGWHQIPLWRFQSVFDAQTGLISAEHRPGGMPYGSDLPNATEISRSIPGDPEGRVLIIQYYRAGLFAAPRLQLRIGWAWTAVGPWVFHQDGDIRVVCDLDAEQSRQVLRHGIPDPLIQDMLRRADQTGAQSPAGSTSPLRAPTRPDVLFSPDPYFD